MLNHPIEGLMKTAMENLKEMIDVDTIISSPIEAPEGTVIMVISKVGFGFVAGGSEFYSKERTPTHQSNHPFAGGSGGGVSITPIGFLVVRPNEIKMIHADENTHLLDRILDYAPQVVENLKEMFKKNEMNSENANECK
ncbi:MAG TPA: GerW family sporulation protein [Massilibacterium sp.]|nr:GerW family sporulation protein [Massilibacterium sp.]